MPQLYVNDAPRSLDFSPKTWGELLSSLDERAASEGVVLSAARFDGVDEPSFREAAVTGRDLSGLARIDVETRVPSALLRDCLLDAIGSLDEVATQALDLGATYRQHDIAPGHDGLKTLAGELGALISLVGMLAGPLQIDMAAISSEGMNGAEQLDALGATIDSLVGAQQQEDWLTVADVLEYDLEPAIRRWGLLLTQLAERLS
jgi:hypothetical protein